MKLTPIETSAALSSRPLGSHGVYLVARYLLRIFYATFGNFQARGITNVPRTGPAILAANHSSLLDPPLVGVGLRRPVWFMTKHELFEQKILGPLMPYLHGFPVHRGAPDRTAIRHALDLLAKGELLVIFPEGERSSDGRLKPPELGVAMLALKSGAPIIPVGIEGSWEMLPPGTKRLRFGRLRLTYGPPIPTRDLLDRADSRERMTELADRVMAAIAEQLNVPAPRRQAAGEGESRVGSAIEPAEPASVASRVG